MNAPPLAAALLLAAANWNAQSFAQTQTFETPAGTVTVRVLPGKTSEEALVAALQQLRATSEPLQRDDPRAVYALRQTGAGIVLDVYGNVATLQFVKPGTQTNDLVAAAKFTDADCEHLLKLASIRTLNISGAKITDASAPILARLTTLSNLQIASTGITDEGLAELAALKNLRYLDLGSCAISGAGLKLLAPLDALLSINLTSVAIGDKDLVELLELPALSRLYLTGTQITDAGVPTLNQLPKLKVLSLYATRISDAALPTIAEMPSLETLYLEKSLVTANGAAWLKQRRPKLLIYGP